jgi:HSP20 family protein
VACAGAGPRYNTPTVAPGSRQLREETSENDVRFADLFEDAAAGGITGDCTPPMDVMEVTGAVEVLLDLPGLRAGDVRLIFARGMLVIAGRKLPAACPHNGAAFHLAERSFGRFMRVVRVPGPVDASRASASLSAGELRVHLPRVAERRGRAIPIPLEPA